MSDITTYTNELLLDFLDEFHTGLIPVLKNAYGDRWLDEGVRKNFKPEYFSRTQQMLNSPMLVVDMKRQGAELYGVEHLWNIVDGNWILFKEVFGQNNRIRTQACLSEITELRHNLAHRQKRHFVQRSNLIRFVQNARMLLTALGSPNSERFNEIEDSLVSGGSPWGTPLDGSLPPRDEIYDEFVGRPNQLNELSSWFMSEKPRILVWGYGGAGKSALAYKFARDVQDSSQKNLLAVCWVSAKKSEYIEGDTRARQADFNDLQSLIRAIWTALYGEDTIPGSLKPKGLIDELKETPILLVVDDFDTVSEEEELAEFLLYGLGNTPTKIIYTSRQRVPGIPSLEAPPFTKEELLDFVMMRAQEYRMDESECVKRMDGIESVTGGYPLFVDDLIRHATLIGMDKALQDWSQRRGDAAREYALRRQIEYLSRSSGGSGEVLMTLSVANKPLIIPEISEISGLTDADAESGIDGLLKWRLVNKVVQADSTEPAYSMNNNTRRLVQQTYKGNARLSGYSAAFKSLTGERVPEAKRKAIAGVIRKTRDNEGRQSIEAAVRYLQENMTGELADSPDLYGVLGRLFSKQTPQNLLEARSAFTQAYKLGSQKVDTYYHWANMEISIAENMVSESREGKIQEADVASQWTECTRIIELGISRCGLSQDLCHLAGYTASREGKSRNLCGQFTVAQSAYGRARQRFLEALDAPLADVSNITRRQIYRGLSIALAELESEEELASALSSWKLFSRDSTYFQDVVRQLHGNHPYLMNKIYQNHRHLRPQNY